MAALILVVDDDPIQRRLLETMTRRFGYEVESAENGEAGLARLEAADRPPVDLIVLDLVMPDLDGMGVLTRMRQRGIAIPAIVQTAHGSIEAVISAMRAGAYDFVVKPVGGLHARQARLARIGGLHIVAESARHGFEQSALNGIVVDYENERGHDRPVGSGLRRPLGADSRISR